MLGHRTGVLCRAEDVPASWVVEAEKALARMKHDAARAFPALAFVRRKNGLPTRNKLLMTLRQVTIRYRLLRE